MHVREAGCAQPHPAQQRSRLSPLATTALQPLPAPAASAKARPTRLQASPASCSASTWRSSARCAMSELSLTSAWARRSSTCKGCENPTECSGRRCVRSKACSCRGGAIRHRRRTACYAYGRASAWHILPAASWCCSPQQQANHLCNRVTEPHSCVVHCIGHQLAPLHTAASKLSLIA